MIGAQLYPPHPYAKTGLTQAALRAASHVATKGICLGDATGSAKSIDGRLTLSNASISAHDVPTSSSLITLAAGSVPMARPGTEYPGSDLKVTEFGTNVATRMQANATTRLRHTTLPKRRRFGHTAPGRSRSGHPSSECKSNKRKFWTCKAPAPRHSGCCAENILLVHVKHR